MCRKHYNEVNAGIIEAPPPPEIGRRGPPPAAIGGLAVAYGASYPALPDAATAAKPASSTAKSPRPACAVAGCDKQSQGRANGYMCRSHFLQSQRGEIETAMPDVGAQATVAAATVTEMPTDPELAEMVRREVERIKRSQREGDDGGNATKRARQAPPAAATGGSALASQRKQAHQRAAQLETQLQYAREAETSLENALEGMTECVICQDETKSVSLVPCGHLALCDSCKGDDNKCPICLQIIEEERHVAV